MNKTDKDWDGVYSQYPNILACVGRRGSNWKEVVVCSIVCSKGQISITPVLIESVACPGGGGCLGCSLAAN